MYVVWGMWAYLGKTRYIMKTLLICVYMYIHERLSSPMHCYVLFACFSNTGRATTKISKSFTNTVNPTLSLEVVQCMHAEQMYNSS